MKRFRVELIAAAVVVIGVMLIIDWQPILNGVERVVVAVAGSVPLSMLLGSMVALGAAMFIAWRMRVRFLRSSYWRASTCPRCGSPIHRVHRSALDKAVSKVFLPHGRRYRCENAQCGWTGLRKARHREVMSEK